MLSAESAAGDWPVKSVAMMNAIGDAVERDPAHGDRIHFRHPAGSHHRGRAGGGGEEHRQHRVRRGDHLLTTSGSTARRIARERPSVPLLVLTPDSRRRRGGSGCCGHPQRPHPRRRRLEMVAKAKRIALRQGVAKAGDVIVVMAGVPFRTPGSTNVLHVVRIIGDELKGYRQ
ncbi:pyruvate kinase alpha/beta domain-containing protein [Sphingomonas sp. MMS24-JH45]